MVQVGVGVEDAQRVLCRRAVVAQHQVQFVFAALPVRHGRDGIVGRAFALGEDIALRIGPAAPGAQHVVRHGNQRVPVRALQHHAAHRPVGQPGLHARHGAFQRDPDRRVVHGEAVVAALEVVVRENRTAHDGQIRVGTEEIVGKPVHEIEQPLKRAPVDAHGDVLLVEHDAVLVVIQVRRILQIPGLAAQRQRDHPVVLPGGKADAARVAGVFDAQHALGIGRLRRTALGGDIPRVLFRLGQVDGDLQPPGGGILHEAGVPDDAVHLDVVHVAAQLVEVFRGGLRAELLVQQAELFAHHGRVGRDGAHQLRGKQVAALAAVLDQPGFARDFTQPVQQGRGGFRRGRGGVFDVLRRVHLHDFQQPVHGIAAVDGRDQPLFYGEIRQPVDAFGCVHGKTFLAVDTFIIVEKVPAVNRKRHFYLQKPTV